MNNFWISLPKPIFTLAPMEDVTDTAFREIVMQASAPEHLHVLFTEFTSTDGMCHPVGRTKVNHRLRTNESEKKELARTNTKLVAQIWGNRPENYYKTAKLLSEEYSFDGLDINMGCPVKKIVKQGACSALIDQPALAQEIVLATKEATHLPVSVKTRTGVKQHDTLRWIEQLLEVNPAAIILHGRMQKDMSEAPANWDEIAKAVQLRNESGKNIPLLGNGDVFSMEDALYKINHYGVDGVMIGRGIFGNPWFFNPQETERTPDQKLALLWKHAQLYCQTWDGLKNFNILKRFFKIYTSGFQNAAQVRIELMETSNCEEVRQVLEKNGFSVS